MTYENLQINFLAMANDIKSQNGKNKTFKKKDQLQTLSLHYYYYIAFPRIKVNTGLKASYILIEREVEKKIEDGRLPLLILKIKGTPWWPGTYYLSHEEDQQSIWIILNT